MQTYRRRDQQAAARGFSRSIVHVLGLYSLMGIAAGIALDATSLDHFVALGNFRSSTVSEAHCFSERKVKRFPEAVDVNSTTPGTIQCVIQSTQRTVEHNGVRLIVIHGAFELPSSEHSIYAAQPTFSRRPLLVLTWGSIASYRLAINTADSDDS